MLAYAAQGLPSEAGSKSGSQLRVELRQVEAALDGLEESFAAFLEERAQAEAGTEPGDFIQVLGEDARKSLAALRLVLAQPAISSQLVDNLNASIHLRALLTDVFLVDEILQVLGSSVPAAQQMVEEEAGSN